MSARPERWIDDEQPYEDPMDRYARRIERGPVKAKKTIWHSVAAIPLMILSVLPYIGFFLIPITALLCWRGMYLLKKRPQYKGRKQLVTALWFCFIGSLINYAFPLAIIIMQYARYRY